MAAKEIKKLGEPQTSSSSREGKMSGPRYGQAPPHTGQISYTQSGKPSTGKTGASESGAAGRPRKASGHVPNTTTARAIREADAGENMTRYESVEEMLKDLEA